LMLAGENDAIWAVTAARAGRSPTTAAATQPATTMPIGTLLLEQLKQGHWTMLALLPPSATAAKDFSFAILDGRPVLAILLDHDEVRTFSWNSDRAAWESTAQISTAASTTQIKLLRDLPHSALWSGGASGGGTIHFNDSSPIALAIAGDAAVQDLTVAAQSIRVLSLVNGKITEYAFAPDGAARGEVVLPQPTSPQEQMPFEWLSAVAAGLLVLALLNTMRRREAATPESLEKAGVELAPMMRRIVAGTIDALPMIAVVFYILMNTTDSTDVEAIFASRQILIYSSTAVYILHTLIAELIWGRSLGKWVCGLRVVTIDGTPPRRRAIVIRNLLRVIDVGMVFMLLVVLFSPLRQRVGDLAAETVVVKAVEPPKT
ncbi:MAG TPA: RDD family protein, partial [Tepidisphaeraceae bacterium]|nr:RDD family protein [Tepidisphaeraceae bacterium]